METLDLLQEQLYELPDTVLLISHDRDFIDKVVAKKNNTSVTEVKKLSFKEQYELDNLPKEIDKLESQLEELNTQMAHEEFYQKEAHTIKQVTQKQQKISSELEQKFSRWDELDK